MSRLLEICCSSLDDAIAAERGGADRIELCEELWTGGLTPDAELIAAAVAALSIPVFVLIRSRGGDFVFEAGEIEEMEASIAIARECGAAGIVGGALTGAGEIDRDATARLIAAARPLPFTFHRAFDEVLDQRGALEELRALGVARVLTAGGPGAADAERLAALAALSGDAPIVLACGGVRSANVAPLADLAALREFHSAARAGAGGVEESEVRALKAAIAERS